MTLDSTILTTNYMGILQQLQDHEYNEKLAGAIGFCHYLN